jgi:hypothetical protein
MNASLFQVTSDFKMGWVGRQSVCFVCVCVCVCVVCVLCARARVCVCVCVSLSNIISARKLRDNAIQ